MKKLPLVLAACLFSSGCILPHSLSAFGSTGQSPVVSGWQGNGHAHHKDRFNTNADYDREWGWNMGLMATWTLRPQPVEIVQRHGPVAAEDE